MFEMRTRAQDRRSTSTRRRTRLCACDILEEVVIFSISTQTMRLGCTGYAGYKVIRPMISSSSPRILADTYARTCNTSVVTRRFSATVKSVYRPFCVQSTPPPPTPPLRKNPRYTNSMYIAGGMILFVCSFVGASALKKDPARRATKKVRYRQFEVIVALRCLLKGASIMKLSWTFLFFSSLNWC